MPLKKKKTWFFTVARLHLICWSHRWMLAEEVNIYFLNIKPRNYAPSSNIIWSICWEEIPSIWHTWMLLWHKLAVLCPLVFKEESATLSNYKEQIVVPSFKKRRVLQARTHLMKCITCRWCMPISFRANIHTPLSKTCQWQKIDYFQVKTLLQRWNQANFILYAHRQLQQKTSLLWV